MPATRELLTAELISIDSQLASANPILEGADASALKRRRAEIVNLLEQLQTSDTMHDPRILRG